MGAIYELRHEFGSDALIYPLSFIKFGSGIQKLIGGIHKDPNSMVMA
jgi:hypothetical protein